MNLHTDLFTGGRWRPGSDGARFGVTGPSDLTIVARFAVATEEDCMAAADGATAAAAP
ncbi:hypothetical protein [Streptomyces sp. enrichment culture]|uniref:hypothetical protein n=1 Tax=Streptomyces sp. enrichment culture TaxID=1795815 RepID=UPI003F566E1A